MQDLHLVGFTTDRRHLIFSARRGAKSGSFLVPVDEELVSVVAELGADPAPVDDDEVVEQAIALAQRISANSPLAVALAKDAALAAQTGSIAAGLEHEKRNFVYSLASDDSHEGQAAFVAKRSPNFTGR